ncbi:toxin co-regulated pilus biosynthesis Q family protein [Pseudomonas coronafaciens]|uniref:toxin co-regulated pilus biosynthesis Q family protein n=1 Tax=Pseudomonas coronafaciens TaxID=53409 RepID=UPI000E3DBED4|nr:toxin co-regulated pilus biosynthesis Q family protein [Pseudomonas coronafaciens]
MCNQFILTVLCLSMIGCVASPRTDQASADQWIDQQIASSAATLSQAQWRLKQTSAAAMPRTTVPTPTTAQPVAAPKPASVADPAVKSFAVAQKPATVVTTGVVKSPSSTKPLVNRASNKPASAVVADQVNPVAKVIAPAVAPPVVVAKTVVPPKPAQEPWAISPADKTLRRSLSKWAARAGWQLVWDASVDVPVNVEAKFNGDFRTAVKLLFQSLSAADVNLTGQMFAGNRVLRVTESGRRAQ